MRLLLTGAGGRIGTAFYKAYARQYQFRLVDRISKHIDMNRCVCATEVEFAIVHGVSNNRFKRLDIANTRKLLGYQPRDDGFRILGYKLIDG